MVDRMKKCIIRYEEMHEVPHGLLDAVKTFRLKQNGFNLNRRIFGVSTLEPKQTTYTQRSLITDVTLDSFKFLATMFANGLFR